QRLGEPAGIPFACKATGPHVRSAARFEYRGPRVWHIRVEEGLCDFGANRQCGSRCRPAETVDKGMQLPLVAIHSRYLRGEAWSRPVKHHPALSRAATEHTLHDQIRRSLLTKALEGQFAELRVGGEEESNLGPPVLSTAADRSHDLFDDEVQDFAAVA